MESQHTITVAWPSIPVDVHTQILTSNDPRPPFWSELTGPESAFEVREGDRFDTVRVVRPELVTIQTFQTL